MGLSARRRCLRSMHRLLLLRPAFAAACALGLAACGGGGGGGAAPPPPPPPPPVVVNSCAAIVAGALPAPDAPVPLPPVDGPAWTGFAGNAQHTALGGVASQPLARIVWSTPVDLAPQYTSEGALLIHYGSPLVTRANTVIVPVKTGASGGFRIEARAGANGNLLWSLASDYRLPPHNWVPSFNPALAGTRVAMPAAGGRVLLRDNADAASGTVSSVAFYGNAAYAAEPSTFDATVCINTPITADAQGNLWFGFLVGGPNPAGLASGIARIGADGSGRWVAASVAASDSAIAKLQTNAAPALSNDGSTVYVVANTLPPAGGRASGYLLALDASTLATRARRALIDPVTGTPAWVSDNASSSPMVAPNGDVYIGVLEANAPAHNFRGWLLHYDGGLTQVRTPGSFGWDDTPSLVPAAMLPQYGGPSSHLLMVKYNNYGGVGTGDGRHRVAILDPGQTQPDTYSSATVMREIISREGVTPDPYYAGGVREWCINTAVVDPLTSSVLMNSEDGYLYRWHLPTNTFSERIQMNNGYAQSYTPTLLAPDGRVYTVNNARLFSVGQ